MESILLTLHIIVAVSLVISVLLQRSEGGLGGLGGGMSNIMSPQTGNNFFTKLIITNPPTPCVFARKYRATAWVGYFYIFKMFAIFNLKSVCKS